MNTLSNETNTPNKATPLVLIGLFQWAFYLICVENIYHVKYYKCVTYYPYIIALVQK